MISGKTFIGGDVQLEDSGLPEVSETSQDTEQRVMGIRFIASCAALICLLYCTVYAIVGLPLLVIYNGCFAVLYLMVRLWRQPQYMRAIGI